MSAHNKPVNAVGKFFEKTAKRLGKARAKSKQPGAYKADDFVADMIEHWTDSVQAWFDMASGGAASPPMCFITGAGGVGGGNASGTLSLVDAVAALPTKPDLIGAKATDGSGVVIKANKVTFAFVDITTLDAILVTVDLGGAAAGNYEGLVTDGQQLLGTIVLQVT